MNRKLVFRSIGGYTLVEVLIAAVIAAFAIGAGMELFVNQSKHHHIQAGISDMQQNGRAAVDELVGKIRRAGYRLPIGVPALVSWDTNPDTIAISFLAEPLCTASLSHPMPQPSSELKCVGCDLSCYEDDTWAYIYDPVVDSGEFFFITHVQQGAMHIQHNLAPLSKKYNAGAQIFLLERKKYYINEGDTLHPMMMVEEIGHNPEIYADNIEDLQFQYVMADGSVSDTISVDRYVREVHISVFARTARYDLLLDNYRRETFATRVRVRNL